jgi:hypothetical protein
MEKFTPIPADIGDYLLVDESSPSLLRWKINRGNQIQAGQVAGTQRPDGRWRVSLSRRFYYTYRIYVYLTTDRDLTGLIIDHKNNEPDCNVPANLRVATRSQNNANRKPKHKYKGISLHKKTGLWRARITVNGKEITTYHQTDEQAARAYDRLASKAHGSFAYLNFPEESDVFAP